MNYLSETRKNTNADKHSQLSLVMLLMVKFMETSTERLKKEKRLSFSKGHETQPTEACGTPGGLLT